MDFSHGVDYLEKVVKRRLLAHGSTLRADLLLAAFDFLEPCPEISSFAIFEHPKVNTVDVEEVVAAHDVRMVEPTLKPKEVVVAVCLIG